ncbi:MAG: ligase-associated DNA damage response endonuclease PdeM [Verrucomicrobiota bacterium]
MKRVGTVAFEAGGQVFVALPDRGLWWPERKMLLVADTHFGKDAVFRREGVPLPRGTDEATLSRLDRLIARTKAESLWVLGDFVHGAVERGEGFAELFKSWRASRPQLKMGVTLGNHDRFQLDKSVFDGVDWVEEILIDGISLRHDPDGSGDGFAIGGHLHPVYSLMEGRKSSERITVFWIQRDRIVLPAFSEFTGGVKIKLEEGDRLIGALDGAAIPLKWLPEMVRGSKG